MQKKENGFSAVEIILVVVVVGLLAVMGWLVWQRSQTSGSSPQATSQTATDTPATEDPHTFRINEWGIVAKNASTYTLQYKIASDNRYADFTAKELVDATGACPAENAPSGRIARFGANEVATDPAMPPRTAAETAELYESDPQLKDRYKKVGDYYYFFIPPQGACSEKETQLQEAVVAAVNSLLQTFGQ